jgi:hypothetical protein
MRLLLVVLFSCLCLPGDVHQNRFDPGPYVSGDGAITLHPNGNEVEPYFATKALLEADATGLDIRDVAQKWIAWMLPRQRWDGRIDRWCRKGSPADWHRCGSADADDSMLALWADLLYRMSGDQGPSVEWKQSADKALEYEKSLRNRSGVYHVSDKNHVALFMDNVEVYSAFKDIGKQVSRWDSGSAAMMYAQSQELASAIQRVFWDSKHGRFRASTQKNRLGFYPDAVAQTYPWLEEMPTPADPFQGWVQWKLLYGDGWLHQSYDPHPWGLVALASLKLDDVSTASCWLSLTSPDRGGPKWNILEEATFQAVQWKTGPGSAENCRDLGSGQ